MNLFDRFVHKYSRLPTENDPDYLEMLQMSKYRILTVPDVKPGKCINCGSARQDTRRYIDIGLEIEWFGAAIFCSLCIKDIAKNLGLFNTYVEKIKQLEAQINKITLATQSSAELEERFLLIFQEVKEYLDSLRASGDDSIPDSNTDVGSDKESSESAVDGTESGTTEQTSGSRSKNVRSFADLLSAE